MKQIFKILTTILAIILAFDFETIIEYLLKTKGLL